MYGNLRVPVSATYQSGRQPLGVLSELGRHCSVVPSEGWTNSVLGVCAAGQRCWRWGPQAVAGDRGQDRQNPAAPRRPTSPWLCECTAYSQKRAFRVGGHGPRTQARSMGTGQQGQEWSSVAYLATKGGGRWLTWDGVAHSFLSTLV